MRRYGAATEARKRSDRAELRDSALEEDIIYTYIGNVLISVNPFKWITGLFDDIQIKKYRGENRIDVPPHIFAVAEDAYRTMCDEEEKQCVIISGESGAAERQRPRNRSWRTYPRSAEEKEIRASRK